MKVEDSAKGRRLGVDSGEERVRERVRVMVEFPLSLSKGCSWFDRLTTNGVGLEGVNPPPLFTVGFASLHPPHESGLAARHSARLRYRDLLAIIFLGTQYGIRGKMQNHSHGYHASYQY
ncbi:MAG: hypothetical protein WBC55_02995 [Dehalococcoidia bacterium]